MKTGSVRARKSRIQLANRVCILAVPITATTLRQATINVSKSISRLLSGTVRHSQLEGLGTFKLSRNKNLHLG
jgi:hypothetical protein